MLLDSVKTVARLCVCVGGGGGGGGKEGEGGREGGRENERECMLSLHACMCDYTIG